MGTQILLIPGTKISSDAAMTARARDLFLLGMVLGLSVATGSYAQSPASTVTGTATPQIESPSGAPSLNAQKNERDRARERRIFGPIQVGDKTTCFDGRRRIERRCADYENKRAEGEADGQAWFNGPTRSDQSGKPIPPAEGYAQIDATYQKHCSGKTRTKSGLWMLSFYVNGLDQQIEGWRFQPEDLKTLEGWAKYVPSSSGGAWAVARYWRAYAWDARGGRGAADVDPAAWTLFRERMEAADKSLLEAESQSRSPCPVVPTLRLLIMLDQGAPKADIRRQFDVLQKTFPEYHGLYAAMSRAYEPRWGGSEIEFDRFAQHAAKLSEKFEGIGMYARMYAFADQWSGLRLDRASLKPKWSQLQAGYNKLMVLYPESEAIAFQYLDFACRVGDGKAYRRLRPKAIGFEAAYSFREPLEACDAEHGWVETKAAKKN